MHLQKGSGFIFFFFHLVKRQDEDYDEQVEESLQDEVSYFEEFFYSSSTRMEILPKYAFYSFRAYCILRIISSQKNLVTIVLQNFQ